MNIFVLDSDPSIAASYHCDQHLHKMILESAQMLSTVARLQLAKSIPATGYYKSTHQNHPCTEWLSRSANNQAWIVQLCYTLNNERLAVSNCADHASMEIVKLFESDFFLQTVNECKSDFVFAGPMQIQIRPDLDTVAKYRKYYQLKSKMWESIGRGPMTWKNRQVPEWFDTPII